MTGPDTALDTTDLPSFPTARAPLAGTEFPFSEGVPDPCAVMHLSVTSFASGASCQQILPSERSR